MKLLVRMLIERGANVNLKNRRGKTACEVAAPGIGALIAQSLDARTSDLNGIGIFERDTNDKSSIGSLHFSCASSYEASGAPCEMRRTPPQNKVDKLSSPRVTLRFHQVKSRDEKKPNSKQEGPTHDSSRVQFTMKMDVGGNKVDDIYEFKSNKDSTPAHGSSTVTDAEKPMASSKLAKEADLRDTGISSDQHSMEGSTRDEKLKSAEAELGKRSHTEANDGEDCDEENRRKKRREERPESGKEMSRSAGSSGRPPGRGMASERCPKGGGMSGKSGGVAAAVSSKVAAGSGGSSGGNTPTDRKSPNASTSPGASPMPARVGAESGESEGEDGRRGEGGAAVGGPKVPPLKIVIPQQSTSGGEGNDQGGRSNGKNGSTRHHHHHSALPYVVSSGGSGDQERTESSSSSSSSSVPSATGGVTITNQPTSGSAVESGSTSRDSVSSSSSTGSKGDEKKDLATLSEERSQRVLRSSHRMASMHSNIPMPTSSTPSSTASTSPPTAPTSTSSATPASSTISISAGPPIANPNISPSNPPEPAQDAAPSASTPPAATVGPACPAKVEDKPPQAPPSTSSTIGVSSVATCEEQPQRQSPALPQPAQAAQGQAPSQTAQQNPQQLPQQQQQQQQQPVQQQQQQQPQQSSSTSNVDVHPRKRKLKKESADAAMDVPTGMVSEVHPHDQPITNCYELFLNIRKQIERRRKGLFPVQPKPPQGFKDYLMNRCTYVLAGNASLSIPNSPPPPSLTAAMKELFQEQEKERYRLRMQHVIEKEKLVLSVEQEILRVHGRAARALANQALPFSACTILKDEEVYNVITPEQEEKDRNARSRYNGRLFLSWLQDVDDKWEKIKESMLLRHHNEAQSLHAVQKMDWEWKLKELGLCEVKNKPVIDEHHVPMVHVSDDFDLLPA